MERTEKSIFLNNNNLDLFKREAELVGILGIDTEFDRTRSYFPKLSIIQFSTGDKRIYLYDFLDREIDPKPIISILTNNAILKVLHSGTQDAEALHYALGCIIHPIIDTQIMADILNFGKQLGYSYLVKKFFGILIEKELTRSNWMHRPFSDPMILYASIDVYYLIDLYAKMKIIMTEKEFDNAFKKSNQLVSHSLVHKTPFASWKSFKRSLISTKYDFHDGESIIRALFLFREYIARKRNILPTLVMDNSRMVMLSHIKELDERIIEDILKPPPYISAIGLLNLINNVKAKKTEKKKTRKLKQDVI